MKDLNLFLNHFTTAWPPRFYPLQNYRQSCKGSLNKLLRHFSSHARCRNVMQKHQLSVDLGKTARCGKTDRQNWRELRIPERYDGKGFVNSLNRSPRESLEAGGGMRFWEAIKMWEAWGWGSQELLNRLLHYGKKHNQTYFDQYWKSNLPFTSLLNYPFSYPWKSFNQIIK